MTTSYLVLVTVALALAGCQTNQLMFPLDKISTEQRLTAADAVPIALAESDKTRIDPLVMDTAGMRKKTLEKGADTGFLWARAFIGGPSDPVLTISHAEARWVVESVFSVASKMVYVVDAQLEINGQKFPIHGEGSRRAAHVQEAMKQAVELGIADTAHQAATVLRQQTVTKAGSNDAGGLDK